MFSKTFVNISVFFQSDSHNNYTNYHIPAELICSRENGILVFIKCLFNYVHIQQSQIQNLSEVKFIVKHI